MNFQGWFPLKLTALVSLLSRGFSKVFSSTTLWKHRLFGSQSSLWSTSHIHTWLLEKPWLSVWKSFSHVWLFPTPWTIQSMEFCRPEYWSGQPFPSPGALPNAGIKPSPPALQAYSLSAEPQGKAKNTGVGSLSLLQWIFPTQELNQGLLHCEQILYQQ